MLYSAAIISVLTYGCSGWELTPEFLRFLNGWNGKRIAFITEREISEECRDPTFDLVARIKLPRMKHAGDVLRAGEELLPMQGESFWQMGTGTYAKEDYLWTQGQETRRN